MSLSKPIPQSPEDAVVARHKRDDASAADLLWRIEQAAKSKPRVLLDLRGDISKCAASPQALDLLLLEHTITQEINPKRVVKGLAPIELGYLLPEESLAQAAHGLADLARLNLHYYLQGLTASQKQLFERLKDQVRPDQIEEPAEEEENSQESGEITLLPIVPVSGTLGMLEPSVTETRRQLQALLKQGMPGIDATYVHQIVTFVQESTANIHDHANGKGFVAANRTQRRYRNQRRDEIVEVYTTYVCCYDFGRGILPALVSADCNRTKFADYREAEWAMAALQLATRPGVTSMAYEEGRGGGLPRMVEIVRSMPDASDNQVYKYHAGLQLVSGGARLSFHTLTDEGGYDRPLPGTQLQLRLHAVKRTKD